MTTQAYLHFGGAFCGAPGGPLQTIAAPCKESILPWQARGLTYTASGYGRRIPSPYMVQWAGRWRRVYVCSYGNASTAYIGPSDKPLARVSLQH